MKEDGELFGENAHRALVVLRWLISVAVLLVGSFFVLPRVMAHAMLVGSDPAANAVREQPLAGVSAWYDLKLNPAQSTLQVFDTNGLRVDRGNGGVDPSDPTLRTMRVGLPATLPPGYYVARWHAVSDEGAHTGHVTEGQFRFRLSALGVSLVRGWLILGLGLVSTAGSVWVLFGLRDRPGEEPLSSDEQTPSESTP